MKPTTEALIRQKINLIKDLVIELGQLLVALQAQRTEAEFWHALHVLHIPALVAHKVMAMALKRLPAYDATQFSVFDTGSQPYIWERRQAPRQRGVQ